MLNDLLDIMLLSDIICCGPSLCLKVQNKIDDVGGKRRYGWNIIQWCKNYFKSKNNTNGDYSKFVNILSF